MIKSVMTDWTYPAFLYNEDKDELLEYLASSSFQKFANPEDFPNLKNLWIQQNRGIQIQLLEDTVLYYDWTDKPYPTKYSYEDVGLLIYHLQYLGM